jgi:hypothetical protein
LEAFVFYFLLLETLLFVVVEIPVQKLSPTQFDSALRPGAKIVCIAITRLSFAVRRLTKLGQRIMGLKQQHWFP